MPAECQHDAACPVASFRDLDADAWYHDGVHACAVLGLMQGVGDRSFQPDGVLTRAQFVTMLWRLAGEAGVNGDEIHDFSDVGTGGYYAAAVQWAVANSIAAGTSATTFSPNAPITREQMAAMLFRCAVYDGLTAVALSENLSSFPDVQQLSGWAMSAMQWAVGAGIITGTPDGALAPQKTPPALRQRQCWRGI
ncbi:MAG: S-layer homology domain-containing protein [Clostridiales bacterium]|nr:S-layer homology domain-containing protein [Clostridiales bacterium]